MHRFSLAMLAIVATVGACDPQGSGTSSSGTSTTTTTVPPACASDLGDCDGDAANGCETPLTTVTDCGACGASCENPHGQTACDEGSCAPVCSPGFGDCDGDAAQGCETALDTPSNCGACGMVCPDGGACSGGVCQPASCSDGLQNQGEMGIDCDGPCPSCDLCIANAVVCNAPSICHDAGVCDPATGVCSAETAKPDGTACNDGNASTSGDFCQGGVCTPTASCSDGVQSPGEVCVDCGGLGCELCEVGVYSGQLCSSTDLCGPGTVCPAIASTCAETLGTFTISFLPVGCVGGYCAYAGVSAGCPDGTACNECTGDPCQLKPTMAECASCCVTRFAGDTYAPLFSACACGAGGPCEVECATSKLCGGAGPETGACAECLETTLTNDGPCVASAAFQAACIEGEYFCKQTAQCLLGCPSP